MFHNFGLLTFKECAIESIYAMGHDALDQRLLQQGAGLRSEQLKEMGGFGCMTDCDAGSSVVRVSSGPRYCAYFPQRFIE